MTRFSPSAWQVLAAPSGEPLSAKSAEGRRQLARFVPKEWAAPGRARFVEREKSKIEVMMNVCHEDKDCVDLKRAQRSQPFTWF